MNDPISFVVRSQDHIDVEIIDGCLVNADGEVVGTVAFEAIDEIVNEEIADAILAQIAAIQGQILSGRIRRDAILANIAAIERQHQKRLDYLMNRFQPLLQAFAARRLKFSKRRSIDLAHGKLAFRKTHGSTKIIDLDKALAFLRQIHREDLIIKTVVEKLSAPAIAEVVDRWEGSDDVAPSSLDFLQRTPPEDKFSIKTGLLDE